MAKINMKILDEELTDWNNIKSNKNLSADRTKEVAESIGFDTRYLCEDLNSTIEYSVESEDISIITETIHLSKTKEGRKVRLKIY